MHLTTTGREYKRWRSHLHAPAAGIQSTATHVQATVIARIFTSLPRSVSIEKSSSHGWLYSRKQCYTWRTGDMASWGELLHICGVISDPLQSALELYCTTLYCRCSVSSHSTYSSDTPVILQWYSSGVLLLELVPLFVLVPTSHPDLMSTHTIHLLAVAGKSLWSLVQRWSHHTPRDGYKYIVNFRTWYLSFQNSTLVIPT